MDYCDGWVGGYRRNWGKREVAGQGKKEEDSNRPSHEVSTTAKQPESKTSITLRAVDWTFGAPTEQRTKKETCDKIFWNKEKRKKKRNRNVQKEKKTKRERDFVTGAQVSDVTGELDVPADGDRDVLDDVHEFRLQVAAHCECQTHKFLLFFFLFAIPLTCSTLLWIFFFFFFNYFAYSK